jgi:hypothetical protein
MSWIKLETDLRNHPKTYRLMDGLKTDKAKALGHLSFLWLWCVDHAKDGVLRRLNDSQISFAAEWSGDAKVFVNALIDAGFVERGDGVLVVHDWHDWRSEPVAKRVIRADGRRAADKRRDLAAESPPRGEHREKKEAPPDVSLPTPLSSLPPEERKETLAAQSREAVPFLPKERLETDIQRVVKGWKLLSGVPIDGDDSKRWDQSHFKRCANTAKRLINLFGSRVEALRCMEYVYTQFTKKGLTCTIETTHKHSDLYREVQAKREVA